VKFWSALSRHTPDFEYSTTHNTFLKEVSFSFPPKADYFHPFEQVANFVVYAASKGNKESVSTELDVVAHHG
jgi:hypothetical protein